jgi:hypothetical protein
VHFPGEEQGEVDHTAPSKGRMTRREGAETVVQKIGTCANPPRGEAMDGILGVIKRRFASTEQIGSRSTDRDLRPGQLL